MSDKKWTPGPWTVGDHGEIWSCDGNVCDAWKHEGLLSELPRDANSHLIAAAPELYDALEEARETILQLINSRGSEAEGSDSDWVGGINEILAKARGEK